MPWSASIITSVQQHTPPWGFGAVVYEATVRNVIGKSWGDYVALGVLLEAATLLHGSAPKTCLFTPWPLMLQLTSVSLTWPQTINSTQHQAGQLGRFGTSSRQSEQAPPAFLLLGLPGTALACNLVPLTPLLTKANLEDISVANGLCMPPCHLQPCLRPGEPGGSRCSWEHGASHLELRQGPGRTHKCRYLMYTAWHCSRYPSHQGRHLIVSAADG